MEDLVWVVAVILVFAAFGGLVGYLFHREDKMHEEAMRVRREALEERKAMLAKRKDRMRQVSMEINLHWAWQRMQRDKRRRR